ncbi:hypothetical protein AX17_006816 [Amanita inopinata Kibby_2008]|nr:hypothetical protein AX17_006816 [Amanita inopinata Kibby_2008]
MDLSYDPRFTPYGAKLMSLSQSLCYLNIQRQLEPLPRNAAEHNITLAQRAHHSRLGFLPTPSQTWASLRNKGLSRYARAFLWKGIHDAYCLGTFWDNIPHMEDRGICPQCNVHETLDHILTTCPASGQAVAWDLARTLLHRKGIEVDAISLGLIFGCGLNPSFKQNRQSNQGSNRLFTIIISETAHLIWKLRCKWRIRDESSPIHKPSAPLTHNSWVSAINRRLKLDILLTSKVRYGKKALGRKVVLQTWRHTLAGESHLPADWLNCPGVLVGIGRSMRPPGRNR